MVAMKMLPSVSDWLLAVSVHTTSCTELTGSVGCGVHQKEYGITSSTHHLATKLKKSVANLHGFS